jgi:predicted TIM-barrel fold metal-dependent hydrolase
MDIEKDAWLKLTKENAIDPELPICDAHHHLWSQSGDIYMINKYSADISGGHKILKTVYVDCDMMYRKEGPEELRPVGETEYVKELAENYASTHHSGTEIAAGMVAYADLKLGDAVKRVLEAHLKVGGKRVRGIRYSSIWDADPNIRSTSPPGLLLDKKFREGFACLKEYSLSFDAWLYFTQLPELFDLARAFPDTTIIINHMGGQIGISSYAGQREEIFPRWKGLIADLATCPNAYVKLGGLGSIRNGFGWQDREKPPISIELAKAWAPYFNWCIEKFGPRRCMFESNFPMDRRSCSYTVLWNAFKRVTKSYSINEKHALFHDTAAHVYRLI